PEQVSRATGGGGGGSMQLNRHSSAAYVGPRLQGESADNNQSNDFNGSARGSAASSYSKDNVGILDRAMSGSGDAAGASRQGRSGHWSAPLGEMGPDARSGMQQFGQFEEEDTIQEPLRMERVLTYSNLGDDTWDNDFKPPEVKISAGAIDSDRMRHLSQSVEGFGRAIWIDIVTGGIAILVGVAITLVLLKMLAPQLFESPELEPPPVSITTTLEGS
ncbi:MAG: hypothetical protein DCC75_11240, partial [Proteobacteria bacterium]